MAQNKSSRWLPLFVHCCVYTLTMTVFGIPYALVNGAAHFATDAVSSRITKRLWAAKQVHWFFVVIGLDQLIHYACLFYTWGPLHG